MADYPDITLQQALLGASLALENGGQLLEDAIPLYEARRHQRAIALAI